jgi:N6-L-threonylcarbamoyladenine synthase
VILAIETSCDDTCAAVVGRDGTVHAAIRSSQADLHARFGGVVPEIAAAFETRTSSVMPRSARRRRRSRTWMPSP